MMPRRLLAPVALIVVALAACGDNTTADQHTATTVTVATDAPAVSPEAGDDTRLAAPVAVDYVLAGELDPLDGAANVWAWAPGTMATVDQVAALATALGLPGEVTEQPAEVGGGYSVGTADSSRLIVGADAQRSWSYTSALAVGCSVEGYAPLVPAEETDPAAGADQPDAPPDSACPTPDGVPTAEDADSLARDLLTKLGLDPGAYALNANSEDWGAWVDAALVVDGVPSQAITSFGFGPGGALTYAAGQLALPQLSGQTTLIGTEAGLARLRSDFLMRAYSPLAADDSDPAISARPDDGAAAEEPITVTIVGVEPDWWTSWSEDGTVTLLPAYAFLTDQGERISVPAVADAELPPELQSEPAVEPAAGG